MSVEEARLWWRTAQTSFERPGDGDGIAVPDASGLTYAARVWSRGDEQIVSFQIFC